MQRRSISTAMRLLRLVMEMKTSATWFDSVSANWPAEKPYQLKKLTFVVPAAADQSYQTQDGDEASPCDELG